MPRFDDAPKRATNPRAKDLNPLIMVSADAVVVDTGALGAIPVAELKKPVDNLREQCAQIQDALDALFGAS